MDFSMVKGFEEMTQNEIMEVDGGIPAAIPVIIKAVKTVYSVPPVKAFVDSAAKAAGTAVVAYIGGKIAGWID